MVGSPPPPLTHPPFFLLCYNSVVDIIRILHTIIIYREIICSHLLASTSTNKIGGPGKTVEIDESLFGLYNNFFWLFFNVFIANQHYIFSLKGKGNIIRANVMATVAHGYLGAFVGWFLIIFVQLC